MDDIETLAHTTWECKYHVVFIPKYRRKLLFGSCGRNWARCSGDWRSRRSAGSRKGT